MSAAAATTEKNARSVDKAGPRLFGPSSGPICPVLVTRLQRTGIVPVGKAAVKGKRPTNRCNSWRLARILAQLGEHQLGGHLQGVKHAHARGGHGLELGHVARVEEVVQ